MSTPIIQFSLYDDDGAFTQYGHDGTDFIDPFYVEIDEFDPADVQVTVV